MNPLIGLLLLLAGASCSRINVAEQDYYRSKRPATHWIEPISRSQRVELAIAQASIDRGKILYENNCLSCHGEKGQGDGPEAPKQKVVPANLQKLVSEVEDFKFFISVSQWQGTMPGWKNGKISETDREDLAAYMKTFRK